MKKIYVMMSMLFSGLIVEAQQFNVLLFTRTNGFHHVSIYDGIGAIRAIAEKNDFKVEWTENSTFFNDKKLSEYQAVIFLNTTGDVLNAEQQTAMEKFIQSGKGFVGIHSASDTEYNWEWYTKLVGRMFVIHPKNQSAYLQLLNKRFPGVSAFNDYQLWTDEWYQFTPEKGGKLNYLISVDEKTYDTKAQWGDKKGEDMGNHPIAWYQNYDGGRSFYTALGHIPKVFEDEKFRQHLYGGIYWAATGKGMVKE